MPYAISQRLRRFDRERLLEVIRWAMPHPATQYGPRRALTGEEVTIVDAVRSVANRAGFAPEVNEGDRAVLVDVLSQIIAVENIAGARGGAARERLVKRGLLPLTSIPLSWEPRTRDHLDSIVDRAVVMSVLTRPLFVERFDGGVDLAGETGTTFIVVGEHHAPNRPKLFVIVMASLTEGQLKVEFVFRLAAEDGRVPGSARDVLERFLRRYGTEFRFGWPEWTYLAIGKVVPYRYSPDSPRGHQMLEMRRGPSDVEPTCISKVRPTALSSLEIVISFCVDFPRLLADPMLFAKPRLIPLVRNPR